MPLSLQLGVVGDGEERPFMKFIYHAESNKLNSSIVLVHKRLLHPESITFLLFNILKFRKHFSQNHSTR